MIGRKNDNEIGTVIKDTLVVNMGRIKILLRDIVLRHGESMRRHILDRKENQYVVVFALTDDGRAVFTNEPKYGIFERVTGLVTGSIEKGETPIDAAKRELLEETGYTSDAEWQIMGEPVFDFTDMIDGGGHYFVLAACCSRKIQKPEIYNNVVLVKKEEIDLLIEGKHPEVEIKLAMSIACLARAQKYLAKSKSQPA